MSVTKLHTGFNIEVEFTISAFHKRLLAWFVDIVVIGVYIWVANQFVDPATAKNWLHGIYQLRPRYMRDQLQVIQEVVVREEWREVANRAMYFCHQNNVLSASDFKAIVLQHMKTVKSPQQSDIPILNPLSGDKLDKNLQPEKSQINDYEKLFTK